MIFISAFMRLNLKGTFLAITSYFQLCSEKTEKKLESINLLISIFLMQQVLKKIQYIYLNELENNISPSLHCTPGIINTNGFVNGWLYKISLNFRSHSVEGSPGRYGRTANIIQGGSHHLVEHFSKSAPCQRHILFGYLCCERIY